MPVCAIVVTYNSGPEIAASLVGVLEQAARLHIVDNASDAETVAALRAFAAQQGERVILTLNDENKGLAAAQNQGIRRALTDGFGWILLLDDDSAPAPDMVARLVKAGQGDKPIGIAAPRVIDRNVATETRYLVPWHGIGFKRVRVKEGEILRDAAVAIASGSLIRASVFAAIGLMCEGMFIDYVDYDFALRARQKGFGIAIVGDATLYHAVGDKSRHGGVTTTNHNAARRYFIFRNRFFILRRYGQQFPFLVTYEWLASVWDIIRILFLESEKQEKLGAALRGLWHGVNHALPPATLR